MLDRPVPFRTIGGSFRPHLTVARPSYQRRKPRPVLGVDAAVVAGALCAEVDPELFFDTHPTAVEEAKSVCAVCPVRAKCLASAMARGENYGVFGGMSATQRRALRRKQAREQRREVSAA